MIILNKLCGSVHQSLPPTLAGLNDDPSAFLIPEIVEEADFEKYLKRSWKILFEHQLDSWTMDEDFWPKNRTRQMFDEWFDLKCSSLVLVLWDKEPLDYAD